MSAGSVSISNLSKAYSGEHGHPTHQAVKGISLEIPDGEFIVLVGPSGCGKTTTLRLIAGLEEATSGTIAIGGRDVTHLEPKDRGVAMVFQTYALYPHMTVFDNMAFALKLAGQDPAQIRETVLRAAGALGLEGVLQRKPQALSGGQRQRVALGRAIVRNPAVFLFDEPLSNLDAQMRVQMRGEILRLHSRLRTTMIYVTHDQVEAMTMGDRICVMRDGVITQVAEPLTLYREPANLFVAGFIGSPPMNLIRGAFDQQVGRMFFTADPEFGAWAIPLRGSLERLARQCVAKGVILGLRPEHVSVSSAPAADGSLTFTAEFAEQMGAEAIMHLRSGQRTLTARLIGEHSCKPGDQVAASFNLDKAHLFDAETEQAITERT